MIDLSIIIISFNTKELTKKCLETVIASLEDSEFSTEIIVLDNASLDGSVEMLEAFEKSEIRNPKSETNSNLQNIKFKTILSKDNLGFAKGNNEAVKVATGKYLLFLNSDTEVMGEAITSLYTFITSEKNRFNFIGAKLLESNGKTPQSSAGHFYTLPVVFAALFLRGDYWGLTRYSPNSIKAVDWVSGACFIGDKEDFEGLGGFDEKIFMYMEEIDLFYRAKQNNMNVGFYPNAKFIHHGSASSQSGRSDPIIKVFEGLLYFYQKHYGSKKLIMLKCLLIAKSTVALAIGRIFVNNYLISTYEKARKLAKSA